MPEPWSLNRKTLGVGILIGNPGNFASGGVFVGSTGVLQLGDEIMGIPSFLGENARGKVQDSAVFQVS